MIPAQSARTSTLSTSDCQGQYQVCTNHHHHVLTEQPQSGQSGDSQADAGTDDQHAVLVADTVVYQTPDYPAGSVTNVGKNPNVGVESVRGYQQEAVRLLPVDQQALGDAHGEETKPDLETRLGGRDLTVLSLTW